MDANEIVDLEAASVTVNTEAALDNRLDSGIDSIKSTATAKRRIVGIVGRTSNTGYIIARQEQTPIMVLDMGKLNAATALLPLDIEVPEGQEIKFAALSTSGTAQVALGIFVQKS